MKIKIFTILFLISGIVSVRNSFAQGGKVYKSAFISGATLHLGNGKVIEKGAIAFKESKITMVLTADELAAIRINRTDFDTLFDATGKHIYPGFIAPNSTLGLNEVDAVRATQDYQEVGEFNPHIRSLISYNTDSKVTPTVKFNGVLYGQITPRGGKISGKSSVFALDGWNWEDAVLKADDGIHLNFPRTMQRNGWWSDNPGISTNENFTKEIQSIRTFFTDARAYSRSLGIVETNLRFEAMKGLFTGNTTLYIHSDYVKDLESAIAFVKEFGIKKTVLVGARDAWKITKLLKQNNIAVMLNRVHDLPEYDEDDIDLCFKTPFLLYKDSVSFCLQNAGDMEGMNTRNLPFLAGTAAAYGLPIEEAVACISLQAAKIMGIDKEIGSLEKGKRASFFISSGNALDMKSNNVEIAFIDGRKINLENNQELLYKKYVNKYNLKK